MKLSVQKFQGDFMASCFAGATLLLQYLENKHWSSLVNSECCEVGQLESSLGENWYE